MGLTFTACSCSDAALFLENAIVVSSYTHISYVINTTFERSVGIK